MVKRRLISTAWKVGDPGSAKAALPALFVLWALQSLFAGLVFLWVLPPADRLSGHNNPSPHSISNRQLVQESVKHIFSFLKIMIDLMLHMSGRYRVAIPHSIIAINNQNT